jgi:agmatinase
MPEAWPFNAFLDLPEALAQPASSKFHILPVPYDGTASYKKGTRFGPDAIIEASQQVELFDEQSHREFHLRGVHTLPAVACKDVSPEQVDQRVYSSAAPVFQQLKFLLTLGGEHSITSPLVRAAKERYSDLSVLQFDAHADLRDRYEGTKYSHACVMRRIFDLEVPFIGVGIRSFCKDQFEFMQTHQIGYVSPRTVAENPGAAKAQILNRLSRHVYITFDIDGLDPSIAPGTGTPEPGGLHWANCLDLLEAVGRHKSIVGADIVEVMPTPSQHTTEFLAARLACKFMAFSQMES